MKWRKWSIATGQRGDFLPIMIGCILLLISVPAFVLLLIMPDRNSGVIGNPLLVWFAVGIGIGAIFIIHGLRVCTSPGSWMYRITHGRFFTG
jgi:hypothetical protein